MKKSKLFLVLSLLIFSIAMTSCGGGNDTGGTGSTDSSGGLKIAIVTSPSGVDDGSFNQNNYEGIQNFIKNNPDATVKAVNEPTGDPEASINAVKDIIADYDVIVAPGYQFAGISTIATENPEKFFILVDSDPEVIGEQAVFDNIFAMTFAEQESGFFAGVAAALETKSNKVAMVGGAAFPPVVNYHFGFNSGVNYVNKVYNKNVEIIELAPYAGIDLTGANVGGNYVGGFSDEPTGKVIGAALISEGADIIFVAAGGSGNGVFTAAKEASDVFVIGCDVDQFDDGKVDSRNVVLTSGLKVMDINVERVLEKIKAGTFKGENVLLQADTDSTAIVVKDGRHQLQADTVSVYNEVFELVKDGTIVPAANFNGSTPDNFVGLPQD